MTPMVTILGIMGVIILFMSGLLVINTISALMAQQIRQIGIMKAVGGRTSQIIWMYLFSMLIIGFIALIIAVPLGNLLTRLSVQMLINVINFDIPTIVIPKQVLFLQVGLSIFVPVLAALIPVITGARITVREAINDYGLSKFHYGQSFFDQWVGKIRGLPRPLLLSLRNTFRQKARLTLTLLSLSLASAIFIAVISVYASLTKTLDQALQFYGFDIVVQFNRPYRVEQILGAMQTIPGILIAETWDAADTRIVLPDGSESDTVLLVAPSTNTALIEPQLLAGRWLKPDDENAIVINGDVLRQVPDLRVGDQVTLNIDEKNSSWTIVGILRSVLSGPTVYANNSYFSRALDRYGQASSVYIQLTNPSNAFQSYMSKLLEDHFEKTGFKVGSTSTVAELRQITISQYNVIFIFLTMMCLLLTIVGGLSLTGTMSLNILERTREIGVLRAVGASDSAVLQIVIVEGLVIGILSWLIGIFLALPLAFILGGVLGSGFLGERLSVTYSIPGTMVWLVIVILLATIASYLPARRAVSLAVRDVLAYE